MELIFVALRNVFRNRRRTALNIIALTLGITVMVMAQGWLRGLVDSVYSTTISTDTGHLQILNRDYDAEKRRLPLDLNVKDWKGLASRLEKEPAFDVVAPRVDAAIEITNGVKGLGGFLRAVDPVREERLTVIKDSLVEGAYFSQVGDVLLGTGLAGRLKVKLGDTVFVSGLDKYGVRNILDARVGGLVSFGYPLLDDNMVFMGLDAASELLALDGEVSKLVVKLKNPADLASALGSLAADLKDRPELEVYEWKHFAQTMVSSIESRVRVISFLFVILFALIVVGILNSMSMSVQERFREIGTMRALGYNSKTIVALFLYEGIWIGLLGAASALIVSSALGLVFTQFVGIDPRGIMPKEIPIPFTTVIHPVFGAGDFVLALALGCGVALLGSLAPARRAGKMPITDALGSRL